MTVKAYGKITSSKMKYMAQPSVLQEVIVTSGGKKVSPSPIEVKLRQLCPPAVSSIMVVGEGRKFISALFALKVHHGVELTSSGRFKLQLSLTYYALHSLLQLGRI